MNEWAFDERLLPLEFSQVRYVLGFRLEVWKGSRRREWRMR